MRFHICRGQLIAGSVSRDQNQKQRRFSKSAFSIETQKKMATRYDPYGFDTNQKYTADVAHVLPRHTASRVLTSYAGEQFWRPSCDVYETPEELIIHCDLPGVPREDIHLELRGDELWIQGTHQTPFESASSRIRERNVGRFRKIIRIPQEVSTDIPVEGLTEPGGVELKEMDRGVGITAKYKDGLLEIRVSINYE